MKIKALFMSLLLSVQTINAAEYLEVGGLRVTGATLMNFGTLSTISDNPDKPTGLGTFGVALILFGAFVNAAEPAAADTVKISEEKVAKKLVVDLRAIARNPSLVQGKPLELAVKQFKTEKSLSFNEKTQVFADTMLDIHELATEAKQAGRKSVSAKEVRSLLGDNYSSENMGIATRFLILNDVNVK